MLEPIYRIEFFLDAIVNNTTPPDPIYRAEFYLAKIAGADVEIPEPVYRTEKYLAYLCGEEVELPDPIYRIEYYLAFLCGLNVELPEPIYRVEFWLWDWCGGGGIEKTITGNPIHILDALAKPAQALSVKLEPIQDLHGYDNPWPSGGGANKWDEEWEVGTIDADGQPAAGNITIRSKNYIPVVGGQTYRFVVDNTWAQIFEYGEDYSLIRSYGSDGYPTRQLDADTKYLKFRTSTAYGATYNHDIAINYPSTVTTYSPYSNICPISGHTDADVTRTGKNLLRLPVVPYSTVNPYGAVTTFDPADYMWMKAGTYTLSYTCSVANRSYIKLADRNGNMLSDNAYKPSALFYYNAGYAGWIRGSDQVAGDATAAITLIEDCYVRICRSFTNPDTIEFANSQLELGSTASNYEAYVGTTYPIPLGQTVYGGTLDVLTGVLTVDRSIADLGSLDWVNDLANGRAYTTSLASVIKQSAGNMNLMSSALYPVSTYELMVANVGTMWESGNGNVSVNALNYSTIEEFKTAMSGVQLCYELATPTTIQLTAQQVELLLGENNLFSDGEMTLVYLADGNASDEEALNILLGGRHVNNHGEDEATDREALNIILGGNER